MNFEMEQNLKHNLAKYRFICIKLSMGQIYTFRFKQEEKKHLKRVMDVSKILETSLLHFQISRLNMNFPILAQLEEETTEKIGFSDSCPP